MKFAFAGIDFLGGVLDGLVGADADQAFHPSLRRRLRP